MFVISEADVRSIDNAPLKVQGRVITACILIYSRDESFRIAYESRIRSRYLDYLPTAHMIQKEFYKRIEQEGFHIFSSNLRNMVGFRNRLVHLYWDVDDEGLLEILRNDLVDFEVFARYIASYVMRQQS